MKTLIYGGRVIDPANRVDAYLNLLIEEGRIGAIGAVCCEDALVIDGTGKKVTVDSGSIDVNAQNAINIKGQNVTVDGTALALKGKSSLNAESSGTTIVKGTMVKIN